MYKIIKLKLKRLELVDFEERKKEILEIYMYLYGYYSGLVDSDKFNLMGYRETVKEIDDKIKEMLNINISLSSGNLNIFDNTLKNINTLYEKIKSTEDNREEINKLMRFVEIFIQSYDYYINTHKNLSIMNYMLGIENHKLSKMLNYKCMVDTYFTKV